MCKSLPVGTELVVIIPDDDAEEMQALLKRNHLSDKVLMDTDKAFLKANNLENILARNRTFLLDAKNRIMLVGEPFNKVGLLKLYASTIEKLLTIE